MRNGRFGAPGGSFGFSLDLTPVVRKLLIANFAVWAVQIVVGLSGSSLIYDLFALVPEKTFPFRPWQLVTYMFLHSAPGLGQPWSIWHILMNSLILAFLGGPVERRLGSRRFLRFYLICGVVGAVLTLLPPFRATTVGASGAVLGVLTAFGLMYPNMPIYILLLFAVPAKYVVIFLAVIQVLSATNASRDGIAYIVHIGGMGAAYLMIRGLPLWDSMRKARVDQSNRKRAERRAELLRRRDEILEKMSREGRDSLSQDEWNTLREESRRLREEN